MALKKSPKIYTHHCTFEHSATAVMNSASNFGAIRDADRLHKKKQPTLCKPTITHEKAGVTRILTVCLQLPGAQLQTFT